MSSNLERVNEKGGAKSKESSNMLKIAQDLIGGMLMLIHGLAWFDWFGTRVRAIGKTQKKVKVAFVPSLASTDPTLRTRHRFWSESMEKSG